MRSIPIDFAPPSLTRTIVRIRPIAWLAGLAAFGLLAAATFNAISITRETASLRADLQNLDTQLARRASSQPSIVPVSISELQGSAVNGAISQLNLPWRDVFDAIEAATPATIALLSLEPDAKKHLLKGMAEAKTSDDMIAYVASLKQQPFFSHVALTRHEINAQDPNRPLRFQFEAQWSEAKP